MTENLNPYEIYGTLPDWALKAHIKDDIIKIDPLADDWERNYIGQVTIDFRLGYQIRRFKEFTHRVIDTKFTTAEEIEEMTELKELQPGQPFLLTSERFITATTIERLTLPGDIVGYVHGKSKLARLGIVVHATAPRFDPGWDGHPTLEIGTLLSNTTILLYPGMKICAFHFDKLAAGVESSYMTHNRSFGGNTLLEVFTPDFRYKQQPLKGI